MRRFLGFSWVVLVMVLLLHGTPGRAQRDGSTDEAIQKELELGAKLYRIRCQSCHMREGKSRDQKLNLADGEWKHVGRKLEDIERVIADGVKGTAMLPNKNKLSKPQITAVAKYVLTFGESGHSSP